MAHQFDTKKADKQFLQDKDPATQAASSLSNDAMDSSANPESRCIFKKKDKKKDKDKDKKDKDGLVYENGIWWKRLDDADQYYTYSESHYEPTKGLIYEQKYMLDDEGNKVPRTNIDDIMETSYRTDEDGNQIEQLTGKSEHVFYDVNDEHKYTLYKKHASYGVVNADEGWSHSKGYDSKIDRYDTINRTRPNIKVTNTEKYTDKTLRAKEEGYTTTEPTELDVANLVDIEPGQPVVTWIQPAASGQADVVEDALFIDGTTSADDVNQGNIGDCYFLSAVLQAIHYDPSFFPRIMHLSGGKVVTRLNHLEKDDKGNSKWVPTEIITDHGLMTISVDGGNARIMGSKFRIGDKPLRYRWNAEVVPAKRGSELKISRRDYFEASLWLNCLEQAYGIFSQKYGRFGEGTHDFTYLQDESTTSRSNAINGGWTMSTLGILFGNRREDGETIHMNMLDSLGNENLSIDEILLQEREPVLKSLIELAKFQDGKGKSDAIMGGSLSTGRENFIAYRKRLEFELKSLGAKSHATTDGKDPVMSDPETLSGLDAFLSMVENIGNLYSHMGVSAAENTRIYHIMYDNYFKKLEASPEFQALGGDVIKAYQGMKVTAGTLFSDAHGENFYMYSGHAYNIETVQFVDKNGAPINVNDKTTIDEMKKIVDLDKSICVMQNPHGQSPARLLGEAKNARDQHAGTVKTSVREVMSAITTVEIGHVTNDRI